MDFINELKRRGLLQDMTEGLEQKLQESNTPLKAYIGYDPTAPSLTIGNLVTIMLLKHWQLAGHTPIILMGGATGLIGDPSGKDAERQLMTQEQLTQNLNAQKEQFSRFLDFEGENAAIFVNNADFYEGMSIFSFLRDIGKNITVNYMMSKDSVKNRLQTGISFTEFSYQIIQGYDFQHLHEKHDCILQMGGGDQWGNITTGTEFIRKAGGKGHGLTCPLLTKSDGKKFGKSEAGNVWLDEKKTSPYKFYQFMLNVADADLSKMFRVFSLRSVDEIEALEKEHEGNPNALKRILAEELTSRVHGQEAYESAQRVSQFLFNKKLSAEFLNSLSAQDWETISDEIVNIKTSKAILEEGIDIVSLVAGKTDKLVSSSDVRRAVKGGALAINTTKITSHEHIVNSEYLIHDKYILMQNGKKNKFVVIAD